MIRKKETNGMIDGRGMSGLFIHSYTAKIKGQWAF